MSETPLDEEAIFKVACQIALPEARANYLAQVCGADRALRERVELLLRLHDEQASFLEAGPAGMVQTLNQPLAALPGTIIGPYKLLEQIGEGGMGTVYMAEQSHPVQRKVALKVIKAGMDSGQIIARFEAERQALALMDHPNIAKVLDAGTVGVPASAGPGAHDDRLKPGLQLGRPYFVMELVKGVPITQYCDENHLPPKARLELFTQVCQAVQHAHQKGIIHRDIKPTNVLVALYDDKPVPKVIDFGVAKATGSRLTERTMFTGYGQIVGTIEYMSPEQARLNALDVDTRGDIYSLGVLLYELLTGTTPFDKQRLREAAFDEMLRMIREEEPPKPSTRLSDLSRVGRVFESHQAAEASPKAGGTRGLVPPYPSSLASIAANRSMEPGKLSGLVRGELDWIVMKALEKDRNRRYETANAFAMDVQRYLADEAVLACPPSAGYRLRKFARRNKGVLTATTLIGAALIAGTVVSTWQAVRTTKARDAERQARQGLDAALSEKTAALQQAKTSAQIAHEQRQEADDARQSMQVTLTDMCTVQGLMVSERGDPAQAILWFTHAASLAQRDTERAAANRIRARNWSRHALLPVAAFSSAQRTELTSFRTLLFHPHDLYVLAITTAGECLLGDIRKSSTLPLPGGERRITAAAWSPDGRLLALGTPAAGVTVFAFPSGDPLHLIAHPGQTRAVAFDSSGQSLAMSSDAVRVWSLPARDFVTGELQHPQPVETLTFSSGGDLLVTGCRDNQARVFTITGDAQTPRMLFDPLPHMWVLDEADQRKGGISAPAFVDGGRGLLTRRDSKEVIWWDAKTGTAIRNISRVRPDAWTSSSLALITSATDKHIAVSGPLSTQFWDVATGTSVGPVLEHKNVTRSGSFTPDGRILFAGGADRKIHAWSVPDGRLLFTKDLLALVHCLACSPDARFLATAEGSGLVRVWAISDDDSAQYWLSLAGYSLVRLSSGGQYLLPCGHFNDDDGSGTLPTTQVYEVASGRPAGPPLGTTGGIVDGEFLPGDRSLVLLTSPKKEQPDQRDAAGELTVWDWRSGRQIVDPTVLRAVPNDLSCSPDGKYAAAICNEGQIVLVDTATGRTRNTFQSNPRKCDNWISKQAGLHRVGFSPDGTSLFAWGMGGETRVWEIATGKARYSPLPDNNRPFEIRFSPDGRSFVAADRIWDHATGQLVASLPSHSDAIFANRFSPDGQQIVTACRDDAGRLWDWRAGHLVCSPFNHEDEVWDAAFTTDGRLVATTGFDKTVRIWDSRTGHPIAPPLALPGRGTQVEVSSDGHFLAVAGLFKQLPVWDLEDFRQQHALSADDLSSWGELVSGQRIDDAGSLENLSAAEWFKRWQRFCQRNPTYRESLGKPKSNTRVDSIDAQAR